MRYRGVPGNIESVSSQGQLFRVNEGNQSVIQLQNH
jgi:hypothetical protein